MSGFDAIPNSCDTVHTGDLDHAFRGDLSMKAFWLVPAVLVLFPSQPVFSDHNATDKSRALAWDILTCDFLKRQKRVPFLKENWPLDATGAALLRTHPAIIRAEGNYAKQKLGIVDTGLLLRGNPKAGKLLQGDSPESASARHGTHVAGIAASEGYGVNPRLRVKMFHARHDGADEEGTIDLSAGCRHDELLQAIRTAGKDPDVAVINVSISFSDEPALKEVVQEAIRNGKWVVYAAGNEGSLNSWAAAGMKAFLSQPQLFAVGALSYFGAPSSFSNFGPTVKWYAPGSLIESLSSRYNPNLTTPEESIAFSGTSMAAPHFSAILATLKAIKPELKIDEARKILEMTAIRRSEDPPVYQVNPYHAVELLSRAMQLQSKSGGGIGGHLERAEKSIQSTTVKGLKQAAAPSSRDCKEWEKYLDSMKKGFFLTNGSEFGDRIAEAFDGSKKDPAERVYFANLNAAGQAFTDSAKLALMSKKDHEKAREFFDGKLKAMADADLNALAENEPRLFLQRLPALPENVEKYLKVCEKYLTGQSSMKEECERFLFSSPRDFLLALGRVMLKRGDLKVPGLAVWVRRASASPADEKLYRDLLSLAARHWIEAPSEEAFDSFRRSFKDLVPDVRQMLISQFRSLKKEGKLIHDQTGGIRETPDERQKRLDRLEAALWAWADPESIKGHEAQAAAALTRAQKDPSTGKLILAVTRLKAGHGSAQEVSEALRGMLVSANRKDFDIDKLREYGDNHFNTNALLEAIEFPGVAEAVARLLVESPDHLKALSEFSEKFTILTKILGRVGDKSLQRRLVDLAVEAFKAAKGSYSFGGRLIDLLLMNEKIARANHYLSLLMKERQNDPDMQQARMDYFDIRARQRSISGADLAPYIAELRQRNKPLTDLPPWVVAENESLLNEYQEALLSPGSQKLSLKELPSWLSYLADSKTFHKLAPLVAERLSALWKSMPELQPHDVKELAARFVAEMGADPKVMGILFRELSTLLDDRSFLKSTAGESIMKEKAGEHVIAIVQILAHAREGKTWLESHPEFSQKLAALFISEPEVATPSRSYPLPVSLLEPLRQRLPPSNTVRSYSAIPRWMSTMFEEDPKSLGRALQYLDVVTQKRSASEIRYAIRSLVSKHPELAEMVRNLSGDQELLRLVEEVTSI